MTYGECVLKYLEEHKTITTFEAYEHIGCTRLPNVINGLEREGYKFHREPNKKKNRYGMTTHFYTYSLEEP